MSFKLCQAAHIPVSALQQSGIILWDYSQQSITTGASVQLTISF